ncbi:dynein axonemal assembly factor 9 isoform X1 [Pocillopora verrucosa]|uniref:dynein axonemal assembly factor 9 isoform X1 n=1 Tax=Pocillopora verrucosa TaxID=203993 RepID=UPI003342CE66
MSDFADKLAFPRPVSAKKKGKHQLYSPFVSCARLRKVQELLRCDKNQLSKIDGILCILGIDSRYNGGTKSLLNYLLFGFCKLTPVDFSGSKITEEELEDILVVVKAESVHVYCNPINYPLLLPRIAHWRNLRVHCLDKELYIDNEEKAEEFKILSFISMVEGCDCLGIPYGVPTPGDQQPCFDPFVLEKWPLIQAFALEGFGSGEFFTMKHRVSDVTQELDQIYGLLDAVAVETLITETLPLFERHCKSILSNVDAESPTELLKVTERSLSEPIVSYFTHGHIVDRSSAKSSPEDSQPFVLLGAHSTRKNIHSCEKTTSNNNTAIGNSGINGAPAKHMVSFAVEPKGRITCARTYFLQTECALCSVSDAAKNESVMHSKDLRLLMELYLLSINAVLEGVKTFSQTFNERKSYSSVLSELKRGLGERHVEVKSSFLSNNVKFSVEACDFYGRSVDLHEDIPISGIKKACLYLYDIPSIEHPGQILGSVVFGESFLDSAIRTLVPDGSHLWDTSFVFLTENIPRFVTWQGYGKDRQISEEIESFAKSKADSDVLGKQLLCGNQVFISSLVNSWETGSLFIYEQGFVFVHPRAGSIVLQTSKISKLQFYDKDTFCALLIISYHPSSKESLPYYLTAKQSHVLLALTPRSRTYRQFYSDVIHLWKERQLPNFPQFETVDDLPYDLKEQHVNLQQLLKLSRGSNIQDLSTAEVLLTNLKGFLCHCSVSSSFGNMPVMCDGLPVILGNKRVEKGRQSRDFELLLTILTGVPGSSKESLCLALVALAKENSKWIILQRPVSNSDTFDPKVLQESLTTTLSSQRRLHARLSASGRRLRVIVVTPGFTDVAEVIQAIRTHPDAEMSKCVKIGAVTCCVDPLNTFMEHRLTLPMLLEQCAQGWVNNVVFTSCLEPQNEQLSFVQKLVRACNPDVAFILAKGGEVTRTPDVELILSDSAFDEDRMVQKRELMCPGWSLGLFSTGITEPQINEIGVAFYGPLSRQRFVSNLKALHGPISSKETHSTGAIHSLQGHACFSEEDPDKKVHVHWSRLNGLLKMSPVDSSAVPRPPSAKAQQNGTVEGIHEYFIVFTGFSLQEQVLKDWLKTCCKPAPGKQKLKTREDLSEKEIANVGSKHKFDPLPPGWFYNGLHYVSLTGDKDYNHPLLGTFIDRYLLDINEEITRQNSQSDGHPPVDIFSKQKGSC